MNMSPFTIYLVMQADAISNFFTALSVIFVIAAGIAWVCHGDGCESALKPAKILTWLFALCAVAAALLPSTKTLCAMVVVPAIVQSQSVQKDFPELYDLAVSKLKESLKPKIENGKQP